MNRACAESSGDFGVPVSSALGCNWEEHFIEWGVGDGLGMAPQSEAWRYEKEEKQFLICFENSVS